MHHLSIRPDIKRRALLAFNKLSEHDPEILRDIVTKARKRLGDSDPTVVSAAFTLADTLLKVKRIKKEHFDDLLTPKNIYRATTFLRTSTTRLSRNSWT